MNKLSNWGSYGTPVIELTSDEQKSIIAGSGLSWGVGFLLGAAIGEYVRFIKANRILLAETGPYPPR